MSKWGQYHYPLVKAYEIFLVVSGRFEHFYYLLFSNFHDFLSFFTILGYLNGYNSVKKLFWGQKTSVQLVNLIKIVWKWFQAVFNKFWDADKHLFSISSIPLYLPILTYIRTTKIVNFLSTEKFDICMPTILDPKIDSRHQNDRLSTFKDVNSLL